MNKNIIKNNFSKYAKVYDKYSNIQQESALKLIDKIKEKSLNNIFEIGCGTGNYTLLLRKHFKDSHITAIDFSEQMIGVAKQKFPQNTINFIIADAEDVAIHFKFDLITSNATFQWFSKLSEALEQYKNFLLPTGMILFSIFGYRTFYELNEVLKKVYNMNIDAQNFHNSDYIYKIMKKNFINILIEEETIVESYNSILELLQKIRYTGERGTASLGFMLNPESLKKIEAVYREKFGDIKASYQIIIAKGDL